jgi:nitrate/TMAO reductase-like tetraheme cytochrome c subunit
MPTGKKTAAKVSARPRRKLWLLALIPAVLIVLGVATVATAMSFENNDDFCASCHSEPESTFFKREAAAPTDLASFHSTKQVNCIDCHSGVGLIPGRIDSFLLGTKDLIAWNLGRARQPAVHTHPIQDVNCLKCHTDLLKQQDMNNHFHIFLSRWQARDKNAATCVSCHQSHNTDGAVQLGFLNRVTTTAVCQACHRALGEGD